MLTEASEPEEEWPFWEGGKRRRREDGRKEVRK